MRSGVQQAQGAASTAANTGANFGAEAGGISANLTPFLTQELQHPQGYSQQDLTQQLNNAEAGAGGASSAITGSAAEMAARSRNPSGFTSALDEAARDRDKAAAGASEGIAAKDADVKLQQQQQGAAGLSSLYGQDTDSMLKSMGVETGDVNAATEASKTGWVQNLTALLGGAGAGAGGAASILKAMG